MGRVSIIQRVPSRVRRAGHRDVTAGARVELKVDRVFRRSAWCLARRPLVICARARARRGARPNVVVLPTAKPLRRVAAAASPLLVPWADLTLDAREQLAMALSAEPHQAQPFLRARW